MTAQDKHDTWHTDDDTSDIMTGIIEQMETEYWGQDDNITEQDNL